MLCKFTFNYSQEEQILKHGEKEFLSYFMALWLLNTLEGFELAFNSYLFVPLELTTRNICQVGILQNDLPNCGHVGFKN